MNTTRVNRAVSQILEWTYGCTNLEFQIEECRYKRMKGEKEDSPDNHYGFRIITDVKKLTNIKHPGALAFEAMQLSITGEGRDFDGRMESVITPGDDDTYVTFSDFTDETNMNVKHDNGGFSVVNVQIIMYTFDGGDKSISRHFVFRYNQMNHIR